MRLTDDEVRRLEQPYKPHGVLGMEKAGPAREPPRLCAKRRYRVHSPGVPCRHERGDSCDRVAEHPPRFERRVARVHPLVDERPPALLDVRLNLFAQRAI